MTQSHQARICILNCYPKASRENFDRSDVGHPHDLFKGFFNRYLPNATIDICFIADVGETLPAGTELNSYGGYVWTGSDLTIYHTDDPRVLRQIELCKEIFKTGVPSFGSCWGIQMACQVAGGEVKKNPKGREWSIARNICLTEAGKRSAMLRGKPEKFNGFIMHLDEVSRLPQGVELLATNDHTTVQAVEVTFDQGTFWATQYHPEYNLFEMSRLISARATPLVNEGFFETEEMVKEYASDLKKLYNNPKSESLRKKLDIQDDIISSDIRELELRNWVDLQVLGSL